MQMRTDRELQDALSTVDQALAKGSEIETQISLLTCRNVLRYALGEPRNGFTDFLDEFRRTGR